MLGVIKKQLAISRNLKESFGRKFVRAMWCVVFLAKAILCGLRSMRRECLGSAVYHNGKRRFISNWAGTESPTICGENDFYQKDVPRSELINERSLSEMSHRFRFGFRFYATNWLDIDVNRKVYGLIVVLLAILSNSVSAQVVQLHVQGDGFTGQGTAVCIGRTNEGYGLYLTAKHNFRDAQSAAIDVDGRRVAVRRMREHQTADVACFESEPLAFFELAEEEPVGQPVVIPGYGPTFNGRETAKFDGVLRGNGIISGDNGLHPIPGDSGAPVLFNRQVVGIVYGYQETVFRSDNADRRYPTRYTGLQACRELLTQRYQCGPGGCKIWIRQEWRQPVGPLGIPYGPPRVVNVAEPVPKVFVPEDSVAQVPRPQPDPISTQGPQGPPGRDGKDGRSVTPQEVESIVSAWLDSNREELAKAAVDLSGLESRVSALERRPFTLILAEDGKEVDRETYAPGQPVILDIRRLKGGK